MEGAGPTDYRPIDCSLHDRLEAIATLRSVVPIRYRTTTGSEHEVSTRIIDIYTRQGEEYLQIEGGIEVRLDRLIAVAGIDYR